LKLPRPEAERMLAHCRQGYPLEACGVLLGRGRAVASAVPVENRESESPRVRYQIDPRDLLRIDQDARKERLEIVGYFHSHPDHPARPSETDRQRAAESLSDGVFHIVVGVDNGEHATATAWVFRDATHSFEEESLELE
jgi:proteasome lid subunit RPN8/RPN11